MKEAVKCYAKEISNKDIATYAASTAFYLFLSFLPILILLSLLLPLTGLSSDALVELVTAVTPDFIDGLIGQVIREAYAKAAGLVSVSLIVILYSAAKGMTALTRGLHLVYETSDRTNFLKLNLTGILSTLVINAFLILSMLGLFLANTLIRWAGADQIDIPILAMFILHLRYVIMLFLTILLLTLLYTFISGAERKLRLHLPGAVLSSVALAVFTWIFSFYVSHSQSYRTIYGSLASFVVLLLWAYACIYIILLGGSFNHFRNKEKREQKTPPQES